MKAATVRGIATAIVAASAAVLVAIRLSQTTPPSTGQSAPAGLAAPTQTPAPSPAQPVLSPTAAPPPPVAQTALDGIRFTDVSRRVGLQPMTVSPTSDAAAIHDAGEAVTTLNGRLAVLFTWPRQAARLLVYTDGRFHEATSAAGLADLGSPSTAAFADLNGDGVPDLVAGYEGPRGITAWLGDGHGHFRDRTAALGLVVTSANPPAVRGIATADVNGDGHPDLLVTDWNQSAGNHFAPQRPGESTDESLCRNAAALRTAKLPSSGLRLYLGSATGRFTDVTREWLPDSASIFGMTPTVLDVNEDGRPDLLVAGDFCSSRLYRNDGGRRFVDETAHAGAGLTPNAMGSEVADLDGDGRPEWITTGIRYPAAGCPSFPAGSGCSGNRVFTIRPDFTLVDRTDAFGMRDTGWAWGVMAADFGNSGSTEVAVANGWSPTTTDGTAQAATYLAYMSRRAPAFFVRTDGVHYSDAAAQVDLAEPLSGRALAAYDVDQDGRLDLLVNDELTGPRLYRNVSPLRHWLGLRVDAGARVRVSGAGVPTSDRWVVGANSYETSVPPTAHVGLGDHSGPVTVRVSWPDSSRPPIVRTLRPDTSYDLTES